MIPGTGAPHEASPTSRIQVGDRIRTDMGDIEALARSVEELDQLQPIVVTPKYELLAGERRLWACERLERDIHVRIVATAEDALAALKIEQAENTERKALTPSERYRLAQRLLLLEKEAARERQAEGGRRGGSCGSADPQLPSDREEGRAATRAAKAVGFKSRKEMERVGKVVEAAESDPETPRAPGR